MTTTAAHRERHLPIVQPARRTRTEGSRWAVVGCVLGAIALQLASLFQPWWFFTLYAPQYPKGLRLAIGLRGMSGDVREIDTLNHYIGMGHLADAAPTERALAGWGIALLAVVLLGLVLMAGKKIGAVVLVPALAFPIAFLADSLYWLRTFGHRLDPRAPLHIPPFTPEMFGRGKIGQFATYAVPDTGFWMALGALALVVVAVVVRRRVCNGCADAATCGVACRHLFLGRHP